MYQCRYELKKDGKVIGSAWVDLNLPIACFMTLQYWANKYGCEFNIVEYR